MKRYIIEAVVSVRVRMPVDAEDFSGLTNAVNDEIDTLTFSESSTYVGTEKEVVEVLYEETDVVDWDMQYDTEEDEDC